MRPTLLALTLVAAPLVGCGSSQSFHVAGSPRAVGADADVKAEQDGDQHVARVEVRATNLAPPSRLVEGGSAFVVWARGPSGTQRLGTLQYDESDRAGRFSGSSPDLRFTLYVTVEDSPTPSSPGGVVAFAQDIDVE